MTGAKRTFMGAELVRMVGGPRERRWRAFTAQVWVYGSTLEELKQNMRDVQGVGRQHNGTTYAGGVA